MWDRHVDVLEIVFPRPFIFLGGHRVERSENPVQNAFNAQQLGIALSKIWGAATLRMP